MPSCYTEAIEGLQNDTVLPEQLFLRKMSVDVGIFVMWSQRQGQELTFYEAH